MNAATAPADASAAPDDLTPRDLRFPRDFTPAPLDDQIRVARKAVHEWRNANLEATERQRGHGSMHWNTYTAELHKRRSVLFTLMNLKQAPEENAALSGGEAVRSKS